MPIQSAITTSYLMTIVCLFYLAKQLKCKRLTLKMKVKVKEEKNGTCVIRLEMFESI